jgi:rubrerythrin
LGIVIIIIGFLVRVIFYRCPECGVMIPWRPLNVKHCPNCGKKL